MTDKQVSQAPVTIMDWKLDRAMRAMNLGELLLLYREDRQCTLPEFGVIEHFVNWIHELRAGGYGS